MNKRSLHYSNDVLSAHRMYHEVRLPLIHSIPITSLASVSHTLSASLAGVAILYLPGKGIGFLSRDRSLEDLPPSPDLQIHTTRRKSPSTAPSQRATSYQLHPREHEVRHPWRPCATLHGDTSIGSASALQWHERHRLHGRFDDCDRQPGKASVRRHDDLLRGQLEVLLRQRK